MRIKVLLFAGLRERLGKEQTFLEVEPGTRAHEVAVRLFPGDPLKALRFAVNLNYVGPETLLQDSDEVALIPPVAGG